VAGRFVSGANVNVFTFGNRALSCQNSDFNLTNIWLEFESRHQ